MMTIEIKINGNIKEVIDIVQVEAKTDAYSNREISYADERMGWRMYEVCNTFRIRHNREQGVRELARLALKAVKGFKS